MLAPETLERAVRRHTQAYRLFRWFVETPRDGRREMHAPRIEDEHVYASGGFHAPRHGARSPDTVWDRAERVEELLRSSITQWAVRVPDVGTLPEALPELARMLTTFLHTSFELPDQVTRLRLGDCECSMCSFGLEVTQLKLKRPRRSDVLRADQLETGAIEGLAREVGMTCDAATAQRIREDPAGARDAASVAYGAQLIERLAGGGEGTPNLVLWRRFAWEDGRPRTGFELSAREILAAEQRLAARLRSA